MPRQRRQTTAAADPPRLTGPRFAVGQQVRLIRRIPVGMASFYTVSQVMPSDGAGFEYRIKSLEEKFVRVAGEHELDEDGAPPE